jgi:hypothetical protein
MSEYKPGTEEVRYHYYTNRVNRLAYGDEGNWIYDEFDRWLAQRDAEVVARTLAAQSTGGVCRVFDADLAWQDWASDAVVLIEGENE